MDEAALLKLLKLDLQVMTDKLDDLLSNLLASARMSIGRTGITLEDTPEDAQLQVMYAAHLYRSRLDGYRGMPEMVRYAIRQRLFSQKMKGGEGGG